MPRYDYQCTACGEIYEFQRHIADLDTDPADLPDDSDDLSRVCPAMVAACQGLPEDMDELERVLLRMAQENPEDFGLLKHPAFHRLMPRAENLPLITWAEGASPTEIILRGGYKGRHRKQMEAIHRARTVSGIKDVKFDPRLKYNGDGGLYRESELGSERNQRALGSDGREMRRLDSQGQEIVANSLRKRMG